MNDFTRTMASDKEAWDRPELRKMDIEKTAAAFDGPDDAQSTGT